MAANLDARATENPRVARGQKLDGSHAYERPGALASRPPAVEVPTPFVSPLFSFRWLSQKKPPETRQSDGRSLEFPSPVSAPPSEGKCWVTGGSMDVGTSLALQGSSNLRCSQEVDVAYCGIHLDNAMWWASFAT